MISAKNRLKFLLKSVKSACLITIPDIILTRTKLSCNTLSIIFDELSRRHYASNWSYDNDCFLGFFVDLHIALQVQQALGGLRGRIVCPMAGSEQFTGYPHNCSRCRGLLYDESDIGNIDVRKCPFMDGRDGWRKSEVIASLHERR